MPIASKKDLDRLIENFSAIAASYFQSPNVSDDNLEAANMIDVTFFIARALTQINKTLEKHLAGSGRLTGSNNLATFADAFFAMADAGDDIAEAINNLANAVRGAKEG